MSVRPSVRPAPIAEEEGHAVYAFIAHRKRLARCLSAAARAPPAGRASRPCWLSHNSKRPPASRRARSARLISCATFDPKLDDEEVFPRALRAAGAGDARATHRVQLGRRRQREKMPIIGRRRRKTTTAAVATAKPTKLSSAVKSGQTKHFSPLSQSAWPPEGFLLHAGSAGVAPRYLPLCSPTLRP